MVAESWGWWGAVATVTVRLGKLTARSTSAGFAGVALIAFSEMDTVLNGSLDSEEDGSLRLNSHVLTVTSTRKNGQALIEPINVTFRNAR
eukprot:g35123.t1